jgi:large subunit ribosomal protein L29
MKAADVRKMSTEEMLKKESELREELSNLSFKHKIRPLENTSRLKQIKKDIARILTISEEKAAN